MGNIKLICYGVRDVEIPTFNALNTYGYELELVEAFLNDENVDLAKGFDAVMVRGNCKASKENIEKLHSFGVKTLLTRTVGFNHVDLDTLKDLNMNAARVPSYSPNAIAELAVTKAMMLLRNTAYMVNKSKDLDFTVDGSMFSKEIRNCTVGIIGLGKIGFTAAKLFKGLGAEIIAYDPFEVEDFKSVVTYQSFESVLKNSDVISIHMPYFKGKNDHVINKETLSLLKEDAILVNTSRGELIDLDAVLTSIENYTLKGFAADVIENEPSIFFKKHENTEDAMLKRIKALYPKVLFTPHIGSFTYEALKNMIETSYENLAVFIEGRPCENSL